MLLEERSDDNNHILRAPRGGHMLSSVNFPNSGILIYGSVLDAFAPRYFVCCFLSTSYGMW